MPHWGISEVMALMVAARQRGRGEGHGHGYRGIADRLISLGVSTNKSSVDRLYKDLLPYRGRRMRVAQCPKYAREG